MKRSPSSSSCSDSSTCIESNDPVVQAQQKGDEVQPKIKRVRAKKNQKQQSSQVNNNNNNNATKRSSIYRGVTRHRWTGRYEAHLWDKSTWNSIQNKRGRQIYLGAYDSEEAAARTYDLAALKYWGSGTILNFPIETYSKEFEEMQKLSKEEYLASLRRQSSGFSRGVSKYRGVARHHHNGRWEARIGRVLGNKYLYLGTYSTQEEAAAAYDMAAIEYRGPNAVTNFDISNYIDLMKKPKPASQIKLETPCDPIEERPKNELLEQEISEECSTEEKLLKQEISEVYTDEKPLEMIKRETPQELIEEQQPFELMHGDYQQYQEDENSLMQTNVSDLDLDLDFGSSMETETAVVMDPEEHHEHPWDLCLDIGFNSLDIPFDERHSELPDLLNDIEFEDNIDLIFDGAAYEIDLNQDAISGNTSSCSILEADTLVVKVEKGHEATGSSPSLSPLSTMSSVSGEV